MTAASAAALLLLLEQQSKALRKRRMVEVASLLGGRRRRRTEECMRYCVLKSEGRMTADFGHGNADGQWAPKADDDGRINWRAMMYS